MKYKLGSLIGKGSDGEVYDLLDRENIAKKVIKFIQPSIYGIRNYLEPYIMLHLDHQHIMKAENIEVDTNDILKIVQIKADNDLYKNLNYKKINIATKLKYMRQLTEAVYYLQQHNIVHGDIKPHNILLVNDNIKLSDFSLSRLILKEPCQCQKKSYTLAYRPPEIKENKIYLKSDIWALACTLYEIYYNKVYFNISKEFKTYHIKSNKINNTFDNLINSMLSIDVNERYSIEKVISFFNISHSEIKYKLHPKLEFEDFSNQSIYLDKCYYKDNIKKINKKYADIEKKIINNYNFLIFENFPEYDKNKN